MGPRPGVIKGRLAVWSSDSFGAKAIEQLRGYLWQPPTRHTSVKFRTHINESDDAEREAGASQPDAQQANTEYYHERGEQHRYARRRRCARCA